jgi:glycosyltransferase involved in cell wall biosynthesis
MKKPLVTVGLTTFNSVDTLESAFESVLAQTWSLIEVIAVDDASTDGTFERLLELAQQHSNLKVFRNNLNGGVAVSRNKILAEARGEFVAFFDDDDLSLPERINMQYSRIVDYELNFAGGAPVICHTARKVVYPNGKNRVQSTMGQIEGKIAPAGLAVAHRILMGESLEDGYGACPTCSQMARLSTYHLVGGFDPQLRRGEDTDFNIRLAEVGGHFVGIGEAMVIQTMTATSDKSLAEEYRNMRLLIDKHQVIIRRAGKYDFCLRCLDVRQAWLTHNPTAFLQRFALLAFKYPLLTLRRLFLALPNIGLNRAFSSFHRFNESVADVSRIEKSTD